MRYGYLLLAFLLLTGCGGRTINTGLARKLIVTVPGDEVEKEDVEVVNVTQLGRTEAIAETRLKTAFRFEKVNDKWVIREVRIGHSQWEKIDDLMQALQALKEEETRQILEQIAEAILTYHKSNGSMPVFKDYISLSDLLSPAYMTPLIRLDAWRRPLAARLENENTILLWSAGPDGKYGTSDDIRRTVTP
jgi:hypothetical protein